MVNPYAASRILEHGYLWFEVVESLPSVWPESLPSHVTRVAQWKLLYRYTCLVLGSPTPSVQPRRGRRNGRTNSRRTGITYKPSLAKVGTPRNFSQICLAIVCPNFGIPKLPIVLKFKYFRPLSKDPPIQL